MGLTGRTLDIAWIVIFSANDDHVAYAAGDEQLAFPHEAQIAGAQESRAIQVPVMAMKRLFRCLMVVPISFSNGWSGRPDFTDAVVRQRFARRGIDNLYDVTGRASSAADQILWRAVPGILCEAQT